MYCVAPSCPGEVGVDGGRSDLGGMRRPTWPRSALPEAGTARNHFVLQMGYSINGPRGVWSRSGNAAGKSLGQFKLGRGHSGTPSLVLLLFPQICLFWIWCSTAEEPHGALIN